MNTGIGSDARWLAYHIDALILARMGQITSGLAGGDTAKAKEAVDEAVRNLENVIGEVL